MAYFLANIVFEDGKTSESVVTVPTERDANEYMESVKEIRKIKSYTLTELQPKVSIEAIRMTISLSKDSNEQLEELIRKNSSSKAEEIRASIKFNHLIQMELDGGSKLQIVDVHGNIKELVFI